MLEAGNKKEFGHRGERLGSMRNPVTIVNPYLAETAKNTIDSTAEER
jgi:hypothetical protein